MKTVSAFLAGLLFSVGLIIGGMTLPINIVGFLDFFGEWRPALAFVMAGALGTYAALYPLVMKRRAPLFSLKFEIPSKKTIDRRLLVGAAVFGIGWGIAGFCPGPSIVALGTGAKEALVFFAAMMAGIVLYRVASQAGPSAGDDSNSCG